MAEPITREEFDAANERGRRALARGPIAVAARYEKGRIIVDLDNGCTFAFPTDHAQGLADASPNDLKLIEVTPGGLGLHWPKLDADLYVPALVRGVLGSKQWMARIGSTGGSAKSHTKTAAARINGAKGGRPRKSSAQAPS